MQRSLRMAAVVALSCFALARPASSAEGVLLGYEGYLGGLHMLTAEVELARNSERYRMETRAEGRGLLGWLVEWESEAITEGVVQPDGRLRPERHRRDISKRGKRAKSTQIEYRSDGVPMVARLRVGDQANFSEKSERRGTMDPMSAVTAIIDQMTAGAACKGKFKVFDGNWRYDVAARQADAETLESNSYMLYSGEAARCDLVLTPIDGFDDEKPRGSPRNRHESGNDTLKVGMWFASPAEGMPSVPVMASANTDFGGLRIYLARAGTLPVSPQQREASQR